MNTAAAPEQQSSLAGQFLIAMPSQAGGSFDSSLIYIVDHHPKEGAFGLIVNQPTEVTEGDVLNNIDESFNAEKLPHQVFYGGPVQMEQGFVLHKPTEQEWEGQLSLSESLAITGSKDILDALKNGEDIAHYMMTLGYSGWDEGQLEDEIKQSSWLVVSGDIGKVLSKPSDERLPLCLKAIGLSYDQLSADVGHA